MDIHWSTSVYILHIRGPQRVCGLLGTRLHRRWAMGEREKLHLCLQPLPIASTATWAPPPMKSAAALDSQRSVNPTVNCTREGQGCELPKRVISTPSPLPLSIEKWSSTKSVPGAIKVEDCCYTSYAICCVAINSYLWKNTQESESWFPLRWGASITANW